MHEKPRGFVSIFIVIRPISSQLSDCVPQVTSHLQYHGISLFKARASDFVSHTFDLNTCCMYRDIQVV